MKRIFALLALALAAPIAAAEPIPVSADTPWPGGAITLDIDASDTLRGLFRVRETIPLAPGTSRLTLLYPQWLPGNHGPRGPLAELVDLHFSVAGKPVAWRRDPIEVNAFHIDLPAGARELVAEFIHTSPLQTSEGRVTMTPEMLNLQWEKMSLYPAGHAVRRIPVRAGVTLPTEWSVAGALDGMRQQGDRVTWATTDFEQLVDSPLFAGRHFRKWDLGRSVSLNVVADAPEQIDLAPRNLAALSALVEEAELALGAPPWDRYEFLAALTDRMGGIGLEHLRSSENQLEPGNFTAWDAFDWDRNVLAHELAHSWNGKYRRPAGMATSDYRTPTDDSLLWVYEGQTQFWGWVLAARSGVQKQETVLGMIASQAGLYSVQPGRAWRPLADTTLDPVFAARKPKPYDTLARGEDYYNEGALIWLEADQLIRAGTGGRKGLDDFAQTFFSHRGGRIAPYDFDDVVAALNGVFPHDWARFLRERIDRAGRPAPLAGIEAAGYRLVWKEEPNAYERGRMAKRGQLALTHSLGLTVDREGAVSDALWGGPAFTAGIVTGARIVAVDGVAFSHDQIRRAVANARQSGKPIELIVRRGERFSVVSIPWTGGLRWPWLERVNSAAPAPLDRLLSPRRPGASQ